MSISSATESFVIPPSASENLERTELGQEDFLNLMLAQMQHQDPFNPLDNNEFMGQIAQFSAVSGIQNLEDSFAGMADSMLSQQLLQGSSLVGRSVMAETSTFNHVGGELRGAVDLPVSGNTLITIRDASGAVVRRIDLGMQSAGIAEFQWDGLDVNGIEAEPGGYFVEADLLYGGETYEVPTLIGGTVNSVSLDSSGSGMLLELPQLGSLSLSEVRRVI